MKTIPKTFKLLEVTEDFITSQSKNKKEPSWLTDLRRKAFENFNSLPWPTQKDERWKHSRPDLFPWPDFAVPEGPAESASPADGFRKNSYLGTAGQINGNTPAKMELSLGENFNRSIPNAAKQAGVEWLTLAEVLPFYPEKLRTAFEEAVQRSHTNKFLSLTLALGDGSCLFIPKNKKVETSIQYLVSNPPPGQAAFPLLFIFIGQGGEASLWEELIEGNSTDTASTKAFVSSYTAVQLEENAQISFCHLQHWNDRTLHFQFQDIAQAAYSRFNAVDVATGGHTFRNEMAIHLNGEGSSNKVLGVLFGDAQQKFEHWIFQNHAAANTTSDIQYRGALDNESQAFFSGMVSILKQAQKSDAYQAAKFLLLSKEASANAIPNLEILANDVKCSHGAAVGPVDEEQKFYLQTRGIPPAEAERAIIQGFVDPVISEVPLAPVQERLREFVEQKMALSLRGK